MDTQAIPLSRARAGDRCLVVRVASEGTAARARFYTLGIVPGAQLDVLRFAPLGDPLQIRLGGSFISIRQAEAETILIEVQ